ncbi:MAG: bifunctional riboflavin kinase/FAD synthetase [Gammaproteobacteria bacterium]
MQLIRELTNITPQHQNRVVTLGNFDGVHLGHQHVFKELIKKADQNNTSAMIITFEPQPREFFSPKEAPARLTNLREKLFFIQKYVNLDVLCLPFNKYLSELSAHDFVLKVLIQQLKIRGLMVGEDFRFGYQRQGDIQLLKTLSQTHAFSLAILPKIASNEEIISSTKIRQLLSQADLPEASSNLGRLYSMIGRVFYGDQRGRTLGFPTANIQLNRLVCPLNGVYAIKARILCSERSLYGVANVGLRPTIDGKKWTLECHFFDFSDNIYGSLLEITFISKIRDEKRFESLDALKHQIAVDVNMAKERLEYDRS